MADHAKRQSTGGRPPVATPRVGQNAGSSGGSQPSSTESTLQKSLGARATIKYLPIPNKTHSTTGFIDSVSSELKQVIIREKPNAGELRLIALDRVLEVNVLESAAPHTMPLPVIPLTQREINARVESEIAKEKAAREHTGQGVDKAAQDLYDAMRRLFPGCRWSGKAFVVNDSALVEPPYGVENVSAVEGVKGAEKNLAYVKKVLESEKKKLADKASNSASHSPASNQRKGG